MATEKKSKLATVGYNEQLVLYFLVKKSAVVNQKQIAQETGIYYTTMRRKLEILEELQLIHITHRGKSKVVVATDEGVNAIEEWKKEVAGQKIIEDLEQELQKVEKKVKEKE
ncbi:MAG: hypothetical protein ACE5OZ_18360 [Candidatus Heimdallarchaeota archaeon]